MLQGRRFAVAVATSSPPTKPSAAAGAASLASSSSAVVVRRPPPPASVVVVGGRTPFSSEATAAAEAPTPPAFERPTAARVVPSAGGKAPQAEPDGRTPLLDEWRERRRRAPRRRGAGAAPPRRRVPPPSLPSRISLSSVLGGGAIDGNDDGDHHRSPWRVVVASNDDDDDVGGVASSAFEKKKEEFQGRRKTDSDDVVDRRFLSDRTWIESACRELLCVVPVGSYDQEARSLVHGIMRRLSKTGTDAKLVEDLLRRLIDEEDAGRERFRSWRQRSGGGGRRRGGGGGGVPPPPPVRVSSALYTIAVDAWAKEAASLRLRRRGGGGGASSRGGGASSSSRIDGDGDANEEEAPRRAEALLRLMHSRHVRYEDDEYPAATPCVPTFGAALDAWAQSASKIGPIRAERILDWMDRLHREAEGKEGNGGDDGGRRRRGKVFSLRPNVWSYTSVVNAYAKRGLADDAERLLAKMEDRMRSEEEAAAAAAAAAGTGEPGDGVEIFRPNAWTYTAVIDAWGNADRGERGIRGAVEAFERLADLHRRTGDEELRPNAVCVTALMLAWSRSGLARQGREAQKLFDDLRESERALTTDEELSDPTRRASIQTYNALLDAWGKSGDPSGPAKAVSILDGMLRANLNGEEWAIPPDDVTWTIVARACAVRGDGARAEGVVRRMEELSRSGRGELASTRPTRLFYNAVLNAWSRCAEPGSARRAQEILDWMEERGDGGGEDDDVTPGVVSYTTVMTAWSRSKEKDAEEKVLALLDRMEGRYAEGDVGAKPNTVTFAVALAAVAKGRGRDAHRRAADLLERIERLHESNVYGRILDRAMYNVTLASCARDAGSDESESDACEIAESILNRMGKRPTFDSDLRPDTVSFDCVIAAWSRSDDRSEAAPRAYRVLQRMEGLHRAGDKLVKPTARSYDRVLAACSKSEDDDGLNVEITKEILTRMEECYCEGEDAAPKPRAGRSLEHILRGMAKGKTSPSARVAEEMIERIDDDRAYDRDYDDDENNDDRKHREACYAHALTVCARSNDEGAAKAAERILRRMEEGRRSLGVPNARHYNLALAAIAKSGEDDTPERAEAIYRRMVERGEDGDVEEREEERRVEGSTTLGLNAVLDAHARSGRADAPQRMEDVLESAERSFAAGRTDRGPDSASYDAVIKAWAVSKVEGAARRARRILRRMDEMHRGGNDAVTPNLRSYSNVLLSCALTPGDRMTKLKNLHLAVDVFNDLRESNYGKPNNVVYNRLLMCAIYLTPAGDESKTKVSGVVFRKCVHDGMLDGNFLKHFLEVSSDEMMRKYFGRIDGITMKTVPPEWTRNVRTK